MILIPAEIWRSCGRHQLLWAIVAEKKEETLRDRVQSALIKEAIVRPESALVISISLLLAVFAPQVGFLEFIPFWVWLLGGVIAEGALIYSSWSDPEFGRQVAAKELKQEFRPDKLSDRHLQQQVNEALDYRSRIEKAIREQDDSLIRDELGETATQIDEWIEHIYNLAQANRSLPTGARGVGTGSPADDRADF